MTYIKIATTSFSAASTVNVDNVFSSAYTHYLVVRNFSGTLANNDINVRLRVSGADDTGANYRYQYVYASSTAITAFRGTAQTSFLTVGYTEATAFGFALLRISNPFDTARTTAWSDYGFDETANIRIHRNVFAHDLATSYTGYSVICTSGTITGSVTTYGLKES